MKALSRQTAVLVLAGSLFIPAACGDGDGKDEETEDEGLGVSETCQQFLDCIGVVDPLALEDQTVFYGPDSDCWLDEVSAATCNTACRESLRTTEALDPTIPECWLTGEPNTELLFAHIGTTWDWEQGDECDFYQDYGPWALTTRFQEPDGVDFHLDAEVEEPGTFSFGVDCSLSGMEFECATYDTGTEDWTLSATFASGFETASLDWQAEDGEGSTYSCQFDGEPH